LELLNPALAPLLNNVFDINLPHSELTMSMPAQLRADKMQILMMKLLKKAAIPGSLVLLDDAHL
jgi:hypothetical protein